MKQTVVDLEEYGRLLAGFPSSTVLAKRPWTVDEDALLRSYWELVPAKDFAEAFRRSPSAVYQRVAKLQLEPKRVIWTKEETQALRTGLPVLTRTREAARKRMERLLSHTTSRPSSE